MDPQLEKNKENKVALRQAHNKELLLEQLRKTPIVEVACSKIAINRSTYYRMREQDLEFAKAADAALAAGTALVNDVAESQLLTAIQNGNLTAIIFWMKNRHPEFKQKLFQSALTVAQDENNEIYFELFGKLKPETEKLLESQLNNTDDHEPKL